MMPGWLISSGTALQILDEASAPPIAGMLIRCQQVL
jgi:hypothetical protein